MTLSRNCEPGTCFKDSLTFCCFLHQCESPSRRSGDIIVFDAWSLYLAMLPLECMSLSPCMATYGTYLCSFLTVFTGSDCLIFLDSEGKFLQERHTFGSKTSSKSESCVEMSLPQHLKTRILYLASGNC